MRNSLGRLCILTSLGLVQTVVSNAQTQMARGSLVDLKGAPISGAFVKNLVTKKSVVSDSTGAFAIAAAPGQKLAISAMGYTSTEVPTSPGQMSILLVAETSNMTEVVIGSRGKPRTAVESPVPVDVVKLGAFGGTTARPDLTSQLMVAVPSFNYNKSSGSDISDAVDFATIRGMAYAHTLVLVNGKRRHISSYISGGGGVGADLNTIPMGDIDHVEVLRDGASAQYGSDAVAGVMNIVLKKDVNHFTMTSGWSGYSDHKYNTMNADDPSYYYTGHKIDGSTFNTTMYNRPINRS